MSSWNERIDDAVDDATDAVASVDDTAESWSDRISQAGDDLAAGDEIQSLGENLGAQLDDLRKLVRKLDDRKPTAFTTVPFDGDLVALPAGKATIDFEEGTLRHDQLGLVSDEIVTISDLSRRFEQESLVLESFLYFADTEARVEVGKSNGQTLHLDYTPIATPRFSEVKVELDYPGRLFALAATKPLNIGLGTLAVNAGRVGERSGTLDSWSTVGVAPYDLYADYGSTYTDPTVATGRFDSATWILGNQSGNGNEIDVQVQGAEEDPAVHTDAEWRELDRITNIPDGDHGLIEVTQEHSFMRARVRNSVNGNTVDAKVEMTEGTP